MKNISAFLLNLLFYQIMKHDIRNLADELRKSISLPAKNSEKNGLVSAKKKASNQNAGPNNQEQEVMELISLIQSFDCSANKQMLHPRLDSKTISLLNGFKLATGIDMNKVISFSIDYLFSANPELKTYIKNTLNNLEL